MPGSTTTPGRPSTRDDALGRFAFRHTHGVGPRDNVLSRLNGWPAHTLADASQIASRQPMHGLGPMWFAIPSSQRTCTAYSLPVSRRSRVNTMVL